MNLSSSCLRVFVAFVPNETLACSLVAFASMSAAAPPPTFNRDVAPIFYARCVGCHRAGESAPMALVSYDDARPWARAIKARVVSREMPPWLADPRHRAQ